MSAYILPDRDARGAPVLEEAYREYISSLASGGALIEKAAAEEYFRSNRGWSARDFTSDAAQYRKLSFYIRGGIRLSTVEKLDRLLEDIRALPEKDVTAIPAGRADGVFLRYLETLDACRSPWRKDDSIVIEELSSGAWSAPVASGSSFAAAMSAVLACIAMAFSRAAVAPGPMSPAAAFAFIGPPLAAAASISGISALLLSALAAFDSSFMIRYAPGSGAILAAVSAIVASLAFTLASFNAVTLAVVRASLYSLDPESAPALPAHHPAAYAVPAVVLILFALAALAVPAGRRLRYVTYAFLDALFWCAAPAAANAFAPLAGVRPNHALMLAAVPAAFAAAMLAVSSFGALDGAFLYAERLAMWERVLLKRREYVEGRIEEGRDREK